jgi:hypothetical protein
LAAESRWIRIESEHFEMSTTASEGSARDTLRYFEQVRGFFLEAMGDIKKPLPVSIIAFNSDKEYQPYRPNEFAAAFFQPGVERDYIVLSHTGSEVYSTAVHEYVHLLARHAEFNFPVWLNEGIADLYSTLKPEGNRIIVGTPPEGRLLALRNDRWVPLQVILAVDLSSPYYNEKNKANSLYSEGWGLTHMLMLSEKYRPGFRKFLAALGAKKSAEEALMEAYQTPLDKIDKDLQSYVRQSTVRGLVFPLKLQKDVGQLAVSALPPFDVKLRLAELLQRPKDDKPGRAAIAELIAMDPRRPEPYVLLGYAEWRATQTDLARDNFKKAFDAGSHNPRMLWDYGRLTGADSAQAVRVLSRLLEDQPARLDARLELANAQLRDRQAAAAAETLAPVKKVTAEEAPRFFRTRMIAYYQAKNLEEAKSAAENLIKYSKDETEIAEAKRMVEYIDQSNNPARSSAVARPSESASASQSPPDAAPTSGERPRLQRRPGDGPSPREVAPPGLESETGTFVELRCAGDKATLFLDTGKSTMKHFLLDHPDQVILRGGKAGTMQMTCGKQKPERVRVEYAPAPAGSGADGLVRVLEWGPEP